jgi:TP901 family phage tail tape measure protein
MPDTNLGTARGEIVIGADTKGAAQAEKSLDAVTKKGTSTGAALGKVGGIVGGAGLAIAAGIAVAVKSAADFETRMSAVKAVSGASADQMQKLTNKALQLGKDTKFSASEAATAIEELVKAGISVPDVMNGAADATVALAAAGEVSLPEAATLAANAMNSFGLSAKEMPKVADLIAGAANASAIDVGQFGQSLQQVGAVAHLAGVSFGDTATAIALLGNAGIKGSDAGTSLKTMFQRLIPQTEKQKGLMEKLGIITKDGANQFFDATGKVKSLADVSQILQTSLKGMTKEQKLATLGTLFGSDAIRGAAVLADAGAKGFDKMAKSMEKVKAADVAKTRMDNFKGSLEQLKGSLETAGIVIGTILLPAIRKVVDFVTGLLNKFLGLSGGTQKLILIIVAAVGAFLLIAGGILAFTALIIAAIPVIAAFAAAMGVAWAAITGPVGIVIAIIALLVAGIILLWKHSETFRDIVMAAWAAIKTAIAATVAWITGTAIPGIIAAWEAVKSGAQALWTFLQAAWEGIKSAVATAIAFIMSVVTPVWAAIQAGVAIAQTAFGALSTFIGEQAAKIKAFLADAWAMLGPPIMAALEFVKAAFSLAFTVITAIVTTGVGVIMALWNTFGGAFLAVVNVLWTTIKAIFSVQMAIIQGIISVGWAVITSVVSAAISIFVAVIQGAWTIIKAAASAAWTLIKGIISGALDIILGIAKLFIAVFTGNWGKAWEAIKQIFKGALTIITSVIQAAMTLIGGIIKAAIGVIKAVITAGWNAVKSVTSAVWNAMKSVTSAAWNGIKAVITSIVNAIKATISAWGNAIKSTLSAVWNAVKSGVSSAWNGIKSAISSGINAAMGLIRGFKSKITGFFAGAGSWLVSAGRNIISGLANGVRAAGQKVVDAALAVVNKVKSLLPGSPVKEGPLKVLNHGHAGGEIVRMLASGIDSERDTMARALRGLQASTIAPSLTQSIVGSGAPLDLSAIKAGNGMSVENLSVTIPAKDIAEMQGVAQFFGRVQQEARRINPRLKMGA